MIKTILAAALIIFAAAAAQAYTLEELGRRQRPRPHRP